MVAPISSSPERWAAAHSFQGRSQVSKGIGCAAWNEPFLKNAALVALMASSRRSFLSFISGFGGQRPTFHHGPHHRKQLGQAFLELLFVVRWSRFVDRLRISRPRALTATSLPFGHVWWVSFVDGDAGGQCRASPAWCSPALRPASSVISADPLVENAMSSSIWPCGDHRSRGPDGSHIEGTPRRRFTPGFGKGLPSSMSSAMISRGLPVRAIC